jgi:hypothetical protein
MAVFDGRHFFGHVKMAALIRHFRKRKLEYGGFLSPPFLHG